MCKVKVGQYLYSSNIDNSLVVVMVGTSRCPLVWPYLRDIYDRVHHFRRSILTLWELKHTAIYIDCALYLMNNSRNSKAFAS